MDVPDFPVKPPVVFGAYTLTAGATISGLIRLSLVNPRPEGGYIELL